VRRRVATAGAGAAWEAALVLACQQPGADAEIVQRCYDLGDLLAVAATGQIQVAFVAAGLRWLDREAVARLADSGVLVVGVAPTDDEPTELRLRQLGAAGVARAHDPPDRMLALAEEAAASGRPADADPTAGQTDLPPAPTPTGTAGPPRPQAPAPAGPPLIPPAADAGRVIAVWGPKGAPGRTTVTVNLAFELARLGEDTLLVDADTYGGSVAQALGFLEDHPGLAWAARLANRGELDVPRLWQAARRAAEPGPRVLTGLPRADLWTELQPATWEHLLTMARTAFPLTVLDLGFCLEEDEELIYDQVRYRRNAVTRISLEQADGVIAVARGDPVGLHDFIRAYQSLTDLGLGPDRVRLVVNQMRSGLFGNDGPEQIRHALARYLGLSPAAFIPYDRGGMDTALLAARALVEVRPASAAGQAFARLARDLLGVPAAAQRSGRTRLTLPRWLARGGSARAWTGA